MRKFVEAGLTVGMVSSLLFGGACGDVRAQGTEAAAQEPVGVSVAPGVRMVRLSAVRGEVQLDRGTGLGFEAGFTNLPIVQGNRLRTPGQGWAEVEFEDGGSLRITPESQVDFGTLARGADGQLKNGLSLEKGTLYVSRLKGDKTDLMVTTGGKKMFLPPGSHVRLDVYPAGSELVVVQGSIRVEDETGMSMMVDHSHALKFGEAEQAHLVPAKDEAPGLYDRWDAAATSYHQSFTGTGGTSNQYGSGDLQYYGNFSNVDGCGRVWRPYLAGAGFDPAASGVWAFYPGAGYSFVSPYAWGWTTMHSGSWVSCGSQGYGWQPGGSVGLNNQAIVKPIKGVGHHPVPLEEPAAGKPTVVAAGDRAIVRSTLSVAGASHFEKDSAGLGIPRGSVSNLQEISKAVNAGKSSPEPSYSGDLMAVDPSVLTAVARSSASGLRESRTAVGRGTAGFGLNGLVGRPVAPIVIAGNRGGGYAAGRSSSGSVGSGGSVGSVGGGLSGGSVSSGGGRGGVVSSGAAGSAHGSGAGSSGGGGHK